MLSFTAKFRGPNLVISYKDKEISIDAKNHPGKRDAKIFYDLKYSTDNTLTKIGYKEADKAC